MKSIQVLDGDIHLGANRRLQFAYGKTKLFQDIRLWLLEPLGVGTSTPTFGSILSSYVGTARPEDQVPHVVAEIKRILGLYQAWQHRQILAAQRQKTLSNWTRQEVLQEIVNVQATTRFDSIIVKVQLRTMDNQLINVPIELSLSQVTAG